MRIAILGNNALAVPALATLLQQGQIVGIGVPQEINEGTDRMRMVAANSGMAVKEFEHATFDIQLTYWIAEIQAEAVFVMTWPWKIGPSELRQPAFGFLNFHFGLLPNYRGAEPVFWQIRNREPFGAVSVHQMDEGWDTGPLALIHKVPIQAADTHGMHLVNLSVAGAEAAVNIVGKMASGTLTFSPQDQTIARYVPKPTFPDLVIDFNTMDAASIVALVNAANPWNKGAYTGLRGMPIRITEVSVATSELPTVPPNAQPGTIIASPDRKAAFVLCKNNVLLNLSIVCMDQGILSGRKLLEMGLHPGEGFQRLW